MAKLYFRYGTVNSAKTLNLLAVAHNYRAQDKRVILVKPAVDARWDAAAIRTRAGLAMPADLVISDSVIDLDFFDGAACVLVDECQFLAPAVIDQFSQLAHACTYQPYGRKGIPVICYGLRTDFRRELFPASRRLMELADSIEEVKTTCQFCERKALFNLKYSAGQATELGAVVDLGAEEKYVAACTACYNEQIWRAKKAAAVNHND
jgi:thymidine kinase